MPNILLLGKFGQLGWELHRCLAPFGDLTAVDYPEIDLTDIESVDKLVLDIRPDVIVNATAYTAVDRAEDEPELAMAINSQAPRRLAELAHDMGLALIHYSTDYVFDGTKGIPYVETDLPNPLGIYGKSKYAGEIAIEEVGGAYLILRTSWVYSLRRDSFVTKVLGWAREHMSLRIVDDQISNPTWCRMLAEATAMLLTNAGSKPAGWIKERYGLYHLAGSGYASRLEWARKILEFDPRSDEQIVEEIHPAQTSEFPSPTERPMFSALNCDRFSKTFGFQIPHWEDALKLAMEDF
jgi:dTDP-4-dehydrorhamnose reductase